MAVHFFAKKALASAATVVFGLWGLLGVATPAAGQVETVVEYGYSDVWSCGPETSTGQILCLYYDSYFVTSSPDEIAILDAGALGSPSCCQWFRTYETFNVWSGPESGALPTCRFFNPTFFDHFYTPYAAECAAIQAHVDWHWLYEGIAFYLQIPDESGHCPLGTTILYRLYNNGMGGRPVHRLTTNLGTFNQMLDEGWVFEGDGRTFAFACVPSSTAPSTP
jgi:hypothetical protein